MKVLVYTIERGDLGLSKKAKERICRRVHKARAQVIFEDDHKEAVREIEDTDILFGYYCVALFTLLKVSEREVMS